MALGWPLMAKTKHGARETCPEPRTSGYKSVERSGFHILIDMNRNFYNMEPFRLINRIPSPKMNIKKRLLFQSEYAKDLSNWRLYAGNLLLEVESSKIRIRWRLGNEILFRHYSRAPGE